MTRRRIFKPSPRVYNLGPERMGVSLMELGFVSSNSWDVNGAASAGLTRSGSSGPPPVWSFTGTGPDGEPVTLAAQSADVLRRQVDGSWRFVIDNPSHGTGYLPRPVLEDPT